VEPPTSRPLKGAASAFLTRVRVVTAGGGWRRYSASGFRLLGRDAGKPASAHRLAASRSSGSETVKFGLDVQGPASSVSVSAAGVLPEVRATLGVSPGGPLLVVLPQDPS
jgi:hypothetical protein